MSTKRIVFPTDFSHCSSAALPYATMLARAMDASLLIVHAEEPASAYGGGEAYFGLLEPDHAELQKMLGEIKPTDANVPFEHHLLSGTSNPAKQIVQFAEKESADLIVLGTHGRKGIKRALMGSIAETVIREAPCPVLVAKQSDDPSGLKFLKKDTAPPAN